MLNPWKLLKKPDPEKEKELRENIEKEGGVGGKDLFAMVVSAFLVLLIPCAVLLVAIYFLARLIMGI